MQNQENNQLRLTNFYIIPKFDTEAEKIRKRQRHYEERNFHLFLQKIFPFVEYKLDDIVKIYRETFKGSNLSKFGFGRLSGVRENFIATKKHENNKIITYYIRVTH